MKMLFAAVAAACVAAPSPALAQSLPSYADAPQVVRDHLDEMVTRCRAIGGTPFESLDHLIDTADLNRDGVDEWIVEGVGVCDDNTAYNLAQSLPLNRWPVTIIDLAAFEDGTPLYSPAGEGRPFLIEENGRWTAWNFASSLTCEREPGNPCFLSLDWDPVALAYYTRDLRRMREWSSWDQLVAARLVGSWAGPGMPSCGPNALTFNTDGTMSLGGSDGIWTRQEPIEFTVALPNGAMTFNSPLTRLGENEVAVQWTINPEENGPTLSRVLMTRCS